MVAAPPKNACRHCHAAAQDDGDGGRVEILLLIWRWGLLVHAGREIDHRGLLARRCGLHEPDAGADTNGAVTGVSDRCQAPRLHHHLTTSLQFNWPSQRHETIARADKHVARLAGHHGSLRGQRPPGYDQHRGEQKPNSTHDATTPRTQWFCLGSIAASCEEALRPKGHADRLLRRDRLATLRNVPCRRIQHSVRRHLRDLDEPGRARSPDGIRANSGMAVHPRRHQKSLSGSIASALCWRNAHLAFRQWERVIPLRRETRVTTNVATWAGLAQG